MTTKISGFHSTITWYKQNARKYADSIAAYASPEQVDEFAALLPPRASVLDAGCASGRDCAILAEHGIQPLGIDLADEAIALARARYPALEFVTGSFLKTTFPDGSFHGIWAHASLVHFATMVEVTRAIAEFHRLLKSTGILHVLVKARTGKHKTASVTDKLSQHERFFRYFTIPEVERLLTEREFEILKLEQYREIDRNPAGRAEVEWILALAQK